jgi:hypothetical protein
MVDSIFLTLRMTVMEKIPTNWMVRRREAKERACGCTVYTHSATGVTGGTPGKIYRLARLIHSRDGLRGRNVWGFLRVVRRRDERVYWIVDERMKSRKLPLPP